MSSAESFLTWSNVLSSCALVGSVCGFLFTWRVEQNNRARALVFERIRGALSSIAATRKFYEKALVAKSKEQHAAARDQYDAALEDAQEWIRQLLVVSNSKSDIPRLLSAYETEDRALRASFPISQEDEKAFRRDHAAAYGPLHKELLLLEVSVVQRVFRGP